MSDRSFVDFYEVLQVSPSADQDTIERVFRHLAKRYHPDNQQTGDSDRFQELVDANRALTDPEARAAYDVRYAQAKSAERVMLAEASDDEGFDTDRVVRERLLSLLYVQRRRDASRPTIGDVDLERLLETPRAHLEFHIWYLREKEHLVRTDYGYAITALGIDAVEAARVHFPRERLLAERAESTVGGAAGQIEAEAASDLDKRRSAS